MSSEYLRSTWLWSPSQFRPATWQSCSGKGESDEDAVVNCGGRGGEGCEFKIFSPQDEPEIAMINVPGQRFTATHGIKAKAGEAKLFL